MRSNELIDIALQNRHFKILATVSKDAIPLSWKQPLVFMVTAHPDVSINYKATDVNANLKENSLMFSQLLTLLVEIDKHLVSFEI